MRLFRRAQKADPAKIAELERELGIGQPVTVDVKMDDVIVRTDPHGYATYSVDGSSWHPYPETARAAQESLTDQFANSALVSTGYSRFLEHTFRTTPDPAQREAVRQQLKTAMQTEDLEQPNTTYQRGLMWLMASAEGLRSNSLGS
jgi:hypothetical protein